MRSSRDSLRVAVIGGGFAAAELLLALRALAEEHVELELIAPDMRLPFRVASPGAPFGAARVDVYDLAQLAADVGAKVRRDTVEAVAPAAHRARLASGAAAEYDALVLAVGARARGAIPGALTFRDQRDGHHVTRLLAELAAGTVRRVAFAAPTGISWPLPLYELSLLTAAEIARLDLAAEVLLVTPERRALEVFGPRTSARVEALLADRGVQFMPGTSPASVEPGLLTARAQSPIAADRVVTIPRLVGRRIAGIPTNWSGFVQTDADGRVDDLPDVFAVGDVTSFPVKQGGLATQQADVVARHLAVLAGADVPRQPVRHILRTRLLGAGAPLYLRAELDADGRPLPSASEPSDEAQWWPAAKLFGRYLSPWMAAQATSPLAA
jgi:sulfide:quinone oxidoreductase